MPAVEEAIRIVDGIAPPAHQFEASAAARSRPREDARDGRPDAAPPPSETDDLPRRPDDVAEARAQEYGLLAALLLRAPDTALLERLSRLQGTATPIGLAHIGLAEAAGATAMDTVQREYFDLFIGIGRGELVPYASYYLTGFLYDTPLARLRDDLRRLGIERTDGNCEPEDHAGTLCEVMSGLADGRFAGTEADERAFFGRHLAPWATRFFADLENAGSGRFYGAVGRVGRVFMDIEMEAFAMER